jgi:histidinol phosphatase-like enzyme
VHRALLLWCDGVLIASRSGSHQGTSSEEPQVRVDRAPVLARFVADGYRIVALAWRPEIDEGSATREQVDASMRRQLDQLGVPIDFLYCPHRAGPPVCWCRSPLPGLGVLAFERYGIDPSASLCVGRGPHDAGFARKVGLPYVDAAQFFLACDTRAAPR